MVAEPNGRPYYDLMKNLSAFMQARAEVGMDLLTANLEEEIRTAMQEEGVQVVLWYAQRMDDLSAVMEEWTQ